MLKKPFVILSFVMLCGFSVKETTPTSLQPAEERKAQDALPQSHDDMWKIFGKCKYHLDKVQFTYSIDYTPEVKAMENKPLTISGFMLPLESTEKFNHFLLSKRTPTCFFCPPGQPNEIIEIFTKKPVKWDEGIVTVSGTMKFTSNPDMGLFFQLKDADSKAH